MPALKNGRHERFCHEYLEDFNGTRAYRASGYRAKNDNVAAVGASKLLRNPKVQERLTELRARYDAKLQERVVVNKESIIRELARLGFAQLSDVADWGPGHLKLKDSSELTPDALAAVKKVRFGKEGLQIELHDKVAPLTRLGDHFGLRTPIERKDVRHRLVVRSLDEVMADDAEAEAEQKPEGQRDVA